MAMAYGGKHRPMEIVLLGTDYTTDLTSVPGHIVSSGTIAQPASAPATPMVAGSDARELINSEQSALVRSCSVSQAPQRDVSRERAPPGSVQFGCYQPRVLKKGPSGSKFLGGPFLSGRCPSLGRKVGLFSRTTQKETQDLCGGVLQIAEHRLAEAARQSGV